MTLLTPLLTRGLSDGLPLLNTWIQAQPIAIPTKLFGLFSLSDLTLSYHDNYLEAGLTPVFSPPTENVPGLYQKFVPPEKESFSLQSDVFEETINEEDAYISNVIREYSLREIFENQFNIFRQVPFILAK